MDSKLEPIFLKEHNYFILVIYTNKLLNRKGFWKFTKTIIVDPTNVYAKFSIDVKNDEVLDVIMT